MSGHIAPDLLNAYLDDELNDRFRQEVERHLETCAACREEYEQLHRLVTSLRSAPLPSFASRECFAATLIQTLPSRLPATRSRLSSTVWLMPLGLLAIWLILRLALLFGGLLGLAKGAGLIQGAALPEANIWTTFLQPLAISSDAQAQFLLSMLRSASAWYHHLRIVFLAQVGVALTYWLWLLYVRLNAAHLIPLHFRMP